MLITVTLLVPVHTQPVQMDYATLETGADRSKVREGNLGL